MRSDVEVSQAPRLQGRSVVPLSQRKYIAVGDPAGTPASSNR